MTTFDLPPKSAPLKTCLWLDKSPIDHSSTLLQPRFQRHSIPSQLPSGEDKDAPEWPGRHRTTQRDKQAAELALLTRNGLFRVSSLPDVGVFGPLEETGTSGKEHGEQASSKCVLAIMEISVWTDEDGGFPLCPLYNNLLSHYSPEVSLPFLKHLSICRTLAILQY